MVSGPILKEMRPSASCTITFSLLSSKLSPLPLLSCCNFKGGDREDPTPCSRISDKRRHSEESSQNASRKASLLGYAEGVVKFRVASTRRNCRIKISTVKLCPLRKFFFSLEMVEKIWKLFLSSQLQSIFQITQEVKVKYIITLLFPQQMLTVFLWLRSLNILSIVFWSFWLSLDIYIVIYN